MENDNNSIGVNIFIEIFEANYCKVKKMAWKLLKSESDAEDVAQEVFARLWERQGLWLNNKRELCSYLLIMTRNIVLNIFKHQQVKKEYFDCFVKESSYMLWDDIFMQRIYCNEMLQIIYTVLDTMPERRRTVFELSRLQGKSNNEIAEMMDVSVHTVERQVYLALLELKRVLGLFYNRELFC